MGSSYRLPLARLEVGVRPKPIARRVRVGTKCLAVIGQIGQTGQNPAIVLCVGSSAPIHTVSFSDVKDNFSAFVSSVVREHLPQIVERSRGKEAALVLPLADVRPALSACQFDTKIAVGDSIIATLPKFGLVARGDSIEAALEALAIELADYSEDFFEDFDFYRHTDRIAHLPWLLRFALTAADERVALLTEEREPSAEVAAASSR